MQHFNDKYLSSTNSLFSVNDQVTKLVGYSDVSSKLTDVMASYSEQLKSCSVSSRITDVIAPYREQLKFSEVSSKLADAIAPSFYREQLKINEVSSRITDVMTPYSAQMGHFDISSRLADIISKEFKSIDFTSVISKEITNVITSLSKQFQSISEATTLNISLIDERRKSFLDEAGLINVNNNFEKAFGLTHNFLKETSTKDLLSKLINTNITYEQSAIKILKLANPRETKIEKNADNKPEEQKKLNKNDVLAEVGTLEQLLIDIEEKLLFELWLGANSALEAKNYDYVRHFSVSLRELFTHIIHKLAPDAQVKSWTNDPNHFSQDNNGKPKPKRKARLLFICKKVNPDEFTNLFIKDTIEIIDLFHEGTHKKINSFTEQQLLNLKIRAERNICFFIKTWQLNFRK